MAPQVKIILSWLLWALVLSGSLFLLIHGIKGGLIDKRLIFIWAWVICGLTLSGSLFLLIYGIKGGLIDRRMLNNSWRQTYDVGPHALIRGWFYIVLGILALTITSMAIMDLVNR